MKHGSKFNPSWVIFLFLIHYTSNINASSFPTKANKLVSYSIPENRQLKKALGYNEDIYLNFTELTTKYKYLTEVHDVITEDGYILTVFRILPNCSDSDKSYPVLLVHGLMDTSDTWIVTGPGNGLGYILADNCYDVWAINNRGNYYSRKHVYLDPNKDPVYWNFTFDEYGNFDLPATIDYILVKTGHNKLFYIGHSQGTTQYFTMCSLKPDYNNKIRLGVQLAPVVYMRNFTNIFAKIAASYHEAIKLFLESAGLLEIFSRDRIMHLLAEFICEKVPMLCELGLSIGTDYKNGTIRLKDFPVIFGHLPSGTAVKSLEHYAQLILNGNFQRYDEGRKGNIQRYGSPKPPYYDISLTTSPVVLMAGTSDSLSSVVDTNRLASGIPKLIDYYIVPKSYWSHVNYLWGNDAPDLIYSRILDHFHAFKI